MSMKKEYSKTKHKILTLWRDVLKLIAIEENILVRLQRAENAIDRLELTLTNIEKYGKVDI